nr:putative late blight resistance protein homolog R1A-10 isoform X1 [Ipomoea batatas]
MAYAAVTSLKETLSLHFLPLEDLEAHMRDNGNKNQGWTGRIKACLHGIFNQAVKQTIDYLKKKLISSEMQLVERLSLNAWHSMPMSSSQLRVEVVEVNQKMISLHENLCFLQDILIENSEIIAKDLEAKIRDASFKAEERIEMELSSIYLLEGQTDSFLHITDCLLRLHEIFDEAEKQTDYLKNELMSRIQSDQQQQLPIPNASSQNETVSLIAWMPQIRLLQLVCRRGMPIFTLETSTSRRHKRYKKKNLDFLNNLVHLGQLEKLSIRRWKERNLARRKIPWATSFLPNLKKLNLLESNLQWSELSLICMLPNLEVLKLKNSCRGLKWETYDGGFRRLKRLVIENTGLQHWNAMGDHFPILECLEISGCFCLKEIPGGFADINTLMLIQLSYCSASLVASAKWVQEEQSKYGNDALLVRSENIFWFVSIPLIYLSPFNMHFMLLEFFIDDSYNG